MKKKGIKKTWRGAVLGVLCPVPLFPADTDQQTIEEKVSDHTKHIICGCNARAQPSFLQLYIYLIKLNDILKNV